MGNFLFIGRLPAFVLLLSTTWSHRTIRAQSGRVIDLDTARFLEPVEPKALDWPRRLEIKTAGGLREAICRSQGFGLHEKRPWECSQVDPQDATWTLVTLSADIDLAGMQLPFITGSLKIVGQCGPSQAEACDIHAVNEKCSQCPTPNEIQGSSQAGICYACKQGQPLMDIADTRPFLLAPGAKLWLENINIRGCRSRGSGGCIAMSNGDNNVWGATSSTQGSILTYLNARNVTVARGYASGLGGGLAIGRGALAVLKHCTMEHNFSEMDGQMVGGAQITEAASHDVLVQNYGALIALETEPYNFMVKLVPTPNVGPAMNIDFISGFLYTFWTRPPPPLPAPIASPPLSSPPAPSSTHLPTEPSFKMKNDKGSLPGFIDDSRTQDKNTPMWTIFMFSGGASVILFLVMAALFYCCDSSPEGQLDSEEACLYDNIGADTKTGDTDEEGDMPVVSLTPKCKQDIADQGLDSISPSLGRNKAKILKPISKKSKLPTASPDWQDKQDDCVAEHLARTKIIAVTQAVEPILSRSRPGAASAMTGPPNVTILGGGTLDEAISAFGKGHAVPSMANYKTWPATADYCQQQLQLQPVQRSYFVRPGSAAASSAPLAADLVRNPLRPPSKPGSAAQWRPRPGSPAQNAASEIINRPSTAPTDILQDTGSPYHSWGFALPPSAVAETAIEQDPWLRNKGWLQNPARTNRVSPQSKQHRADGHRPGASRLSQPGAALKPLHEGKISAWGE